MQQVHVQPSVMMPCQKLTQCNSSFIPSLVKGLAVSVSSTMSQAFKYAIQQRSWTHGPCYIVKHIGHSNLKCIKINIPI